MKPYKRHSKPGYKRARMDFHPAHRGYEDYLKPESPVVHVSLRGRQELITLSSCEIPTKLIEGGGNPPTFQYRETAS